MAEPNLIRAIGLKKRFRSVVAVDGVDFRVGRGEYVALLGPNGAGKTTLVEMIEGIRHPDEGEIFIKEKRLKDNKLELYRILGISLQETRFLEKITVEETLDLFASFYEVKSTKIDHVIRMTDLDEKRKAYTKNLSGGQRQRLALAISLLNDPEILILDEPTTGLDPTARHEIWNILKQFKAEGNTSLILTTHYMEEATALCDRIIIMDHGKFLAEGTLESLLDRMKMKKVAHFRILEEVPADSHSWNGRFHMHWDNAQKRGWCELGSLAEDLPALFDIFEKQGLTILEFDYRKPTLDDLFVAMTGRRLNE